MPQNVSVLSGSIRKFRKYGFYGLFFRQNVSEREERILDRVPTGVEAVIFLVGDLPLHRGDGTATRQTAGILRVHSADYFFLHPLVAPPRWSASCRINRGAAVRLRRLEKTSAETPSSSFSGALYSLSLLPIRSWYLVILTRRRVLPPSRQGAVN